MLADISISFPNLGIEIENLHKSFRIFGFDVAYYGLIIGIGMVLAIIVCFREAKITGQNVDDYLDVALYGIISAIIGARLYYVIFQWDHYKNNLSSIFNIRQGGLAIYGGIIGGLLAGLVIAKIKKLNFWQLADTASMGFLIGQIIGRWGNFVNREAFGGNTNSLFAMKINCKDPLANVVVPDGVSYIDSACQWISVQPTFLYESFFNLLLLILVIVFRKKKQYHGEIFMWYIGGYGLIRFFIEGMRTDQLIMPIFNIPVSQALSLAIVVLMFILLLANRISIKKKGTTAFGVFKMIEVKQEMLVTEETDESNEVKQETVKENK